ncbi:N-alpha-acetyltransferase 35 NatC auxiliary subunit [Biomphalaria glabrata]|uniref:Protein MAK10 homolog n=1 Tax=Biomphalaria glabrata TaxID=6526 RepID=A0A9W3BEU7_BIOGL|nr:N-alpha-acetyltransferase 35, NatC auxiliary subunit-like isoform X2 [Biomphalaria glabrata]KAI8769553.1 N-alpha-acetyltransferase 35; NatC auxiliary subunit-like [Biomphalaria glabrata]KAI8789897.1 N-alpha-acetyltransferase 35, NatC auxiliary subunit [Biomphalaria glabrata]
MASSENDKLEYPKFKWVDITKEFFTASSFLHLGELVHDCSFGLFEAMSAIEMMDPKMDAGMLCNQIKRKVLTLEQSIEEGCLRIKDLSYRELIGIMDASLACLVTWIEGHSLAQTVFTNLYLHNPYIIEDRVLKAFCIIMLKIVDHIRERINRAGTVEEEDFQPMSYGFKMAGDVSESRALGMIKEVEEELGKIRKNTRSKAGEERSEVQNEQHQLVTAVHVRLQFYKLFYSTLLSFAKEKCEGIPVVKKNLSQMSELIPTMIETVSLGIQEESPPASKNDYPTISGFEPLINQRLLPPTFPRYTVIKPRLDSMNYMTSLVQKMSFITTVPDLGYLHNILDAFMEFSKSSPCVLSRSILQMMLLPPNRRVFGTHSMVDTLKETVRGFIAPPGLSPKSSIYNHPQAKEYIDALMSRAVRPFCILFQITGHNRARQRDKWANILEDLSNLQEEADKVDAYLHTLLIKTEKNRNHLACFGTWVLYHTLNAMINYTISGFELELYAIFEYHYIYWYLYEILYAWLVSTLHRADSFLLDAENAPDMSLKGRNSKKIKKKKRTKTLTRELTIAQAYQQMFGGYYKAVIGFQLCGKLKIPEFRFDSEEVRYAHRFAPFSNVLTPPMVHYAQYKEMSDLRRYDPQPSTVEMFSSACKCFCQAKDLLETISPLTDEIQTVIKIAKINFVVMKLAVGGHKENSMVPPEFDFSQHRIFPVIKMV